MGNANNDSKKALSVDELAEQLNNPAVLQMAIAKASTLGMLPKQEPVKQEVKEEEDDAPEPIDLPEDATMKDVIAAFNKTLGDHLKYMSKQFDKKQQGVIQTVKAEKAQTERQKVQEFAKGKEKYFQDPAFFKKMDQLYSTGVSIEEAFEDAKKILGAKDEPKKEAKKQEATQLPVTNISSSEGSDDDDKKAKGYTKTEDASKAALAKIMADMPDAAKIISGEGIE